MSLTLRSRKTLLTQNSNSVIQQCLVCETHQLDVQKVCLLPDCKYNNISFCDQCLATQTKHLGMHMDSIINYNDFIAIIKQLSLQQKQRYDGQFSDKEFHNILSKLEKEQVLFKKHIKVQQEEIEQQFNIIQNNVIEIFNEMKQNLKQKFYDYQNLFDEKCEALKNRANELNEERISNKDYKNEFDNLLESLLGKKNNLKKLMTNVYPLMKKLQIKSTQENLKSTSFSDNISLYSNVTSQSILTLNLQSNPYLVPLTDQFQELKTLIKEKPVFKINNNSQEKLVQEIDFQLNKIKNQFMDKINDYIREDIKWKKETQVTQISEEFSPKKVQFSFCQKKSKIVYQDSVNTEYNGITNIKNLDDYSFILTSGKELAVYKYNTYNLERKISLPYNITSLDVLKRLDHSLMTVVGLTKGFVLLNQAQEIYKQFESEHQTSLIQIVACNDCESVITIATNDNKIVLQNLFAKIKNRKYFDHKDSVTCLDFNSSLNTLISGGKDKSIKVWKLQHNNIQVELLQLDYSISNCHETDVSALIIGPLYELVVSGSANGEIKIWDLMTGKLLRLIKNFNGWVYKLFVFEQQYDIENGSNLTSVYYLYNKETKVANIIANQKQFPQESSSSIYQF